MTESIQTYSNDALGVTVRTLIDEETGEPWFVAKDVCDALGIRTNSIRAIVDDDEVRDSNDNSIGIAQHGGKAPLIVSEPGLYTLVLKSRKPEAKAFRRWVTHEVLPAIRRTGSYGSPAEARMERLLSDGAALIEAQSARIREMEPKAAFAEAVEGSETLHSVGELAKVISQAGVPMGQRRLFGLLRDDGWLMKRGRDKNLPTQRAREMDVIRIEMAHYVDGKGMTHFFRVYGLGRAQLALPIPE